MYEEMDKVFASVSALAEKGEPVPIQDAYYCYTVSLKITSYTRFSFV